MNDFSGGIGMEGITIPILTPPELPRALDQIADKVDHIGERAERTGGAWSRFSGAVESSSRAYLTVSAAAGDLFDRLDAGAARVARLADEQHRLNDVGSQLGLSFDEAAASAGRFADETEAMGAASQFLQRDVRLTQQELNALERVAGAASRTLGTTTAEATNRLTEALITGRRQGLAVFGEGLSDLAGPSHTIGERLEALTRRANDVTPATDDASDAMARFRDNLEDSERTFATAFVDGLSRLTSVAEGTRDASQATIDWQTNLTALGNTAAEVALRVGNGIATVVGGVATLIAGAANGIGMIGAGAAAIASGRNPADAMRAYAADSPIFDALASFTADRANALERLDGESNDRTSMAAPGAGGGASRTGAGAGADAAARGHRRGRGSGGGRGHGRRGADMAFTLDDARLGEGGEHYDAGLRAAAADDLRTGRDAERGTVDGLLRGERGREEADKARTRQHDEESQNKARLDSLDTFTNRFRELYREQTSIAQSAAETIAAAFEGVGKAIASHIEAVVAGQETAGEALKGILADTLGAFSKDAYAKGSLYAAEALGMLVTGNLPGAGTAAAASAAYFVAGAATGAAASALGGGGGSSSAASSSAGGGSAPASGRTIGSGSGSSSGDGQTVVEHHYYAPVIGGRSATDHEMGSRLGRYERARSDRQQRERS